MNEMIVILTRNVIKPRFIKGWRVCERWDIALWPACRNDYDNSKPLHKTTVYGHLVHAKNEAHTVYGSVSQTIVDKVSP